MESPNLKLDGLYPDFAVRVRRIYEDVERTTQLKLKPTTLVRDVETQQKLYEKGRTLVKGVWQIVDKKLIVTKAPGGLSFHAYGLAVDSAWQGKYPYLENQTKAEFERLWRAYGGAVNAHGCKWGGDWNFNGVQDPDDFDRPHCELGYGLGVRKLLHLYSEGGRDAVWSTLDQIRGVPIASEWKPLSHS